jgi:anti-sigma B factor antagonist
MPNVAAADCLTLETERKDGIILVRCKGKLLSGVSDAFYAKMSKLIPDTRRLVLDLTDLTHMDSMGLGSLVRLLVSAKAAGCKLELINIGKRIKELLGLTHLLAVFTTIGEHSGSIRF